MPRKAKKSKLHTGLDTIITNISLLICYQKLFRTKLEDDVTTAASIPVKYKWRDDLIRYDPELKLYEVFNCIVFHDNPSDDGLIMSPKNYYRIYYTFMKMMTIHLEDIGSTPIDDEDDSDDIYSQFDQDLKVGIKIPPSSASAVIGYVSVLQPLMEKRSDIGMCLSLELHNQMEMDETCDKTVLQMIRYQGKEGTDEENESAVEDSDDDNNSVIEEDQTKIDTEDTDTDEDEEIVQVNTIQEIPRSPEPVKISNKVPEWYPEIRNMMIDFRAGRNSPNIVKFMNSHGFNWWLRIPPVGSTIIRAG